MAKMVIRLEVEVEDTMGWVEIKEMVVAQVVGEVRECLLRELLWQEDGVWSAVAKRLGIGNVTLWRFRGKEKRRCS